MAKLPPAECPCCGQNIRRIWVMHNHVKVGMKFRRHTAPCGLPCLLPSEADWGDVTHVITEECPACARLLTARSQIFVDGKVYNKNQDPRRKYAPVPARPEYVPTPPTPPEPKTPWGQIVIPPHAIKMMKIRAGFESVVDAVNMIERLYPLTEYNSSQKTAQGTSHTKRSKPGKNKHKSQRVDLYTVKDDDGVEWTFFMKRNVLMTVHRNDEFDFGGPRLDNNELTSNG